MKHPDSDQLDEYALGRGRSKAIGDHLLDCQECRDAVEEVALLREALRVVQQEQEPAHAA